MREKRQAVSLFVDGRIGNNSNSDGASRHFDETAYRRAS